MAEQPKMTEFEMALEAAEKAQSSPKASRVHWPAPGAAGSAYPAPPTKTGAKAGAPQLVPAQKPPPGAHTEEKPEEAGAKKPPTALIAAAVALVVIAGIVFLMTKKKGGSAESTVADTTVSEPATASPPAVRPTGGGGGGAAAGAPAAPTASAAPKGSTSAAPKQSSPSTGPAATTPAAPTTPAEPTYVPINANKLGQLNQSIGISYYEAISIIGGEGKLIADGVEPSTGNRVTVYEWPAEGLDGKSVDLKFFNGILNKVAVL